jgi:mannitol-1-phosphate 5-dehydrogenase
MTEKKKLVQFGAGSIGRSLMGQLFSRAGYEVVFVDIDSALVDSLNREREYRIVVRQAEATDEVITVRGVRALDFRDREAVLREVADASLLCTSVGKGAVPQVLPAIADGIMHRRLFGNNRPVDIIIAENMRNAAPFCRKVLSEHLSPGFPVSELIGLAETSIGKMVPIMTREEREQDPLRIFAEAYNKLIVDRNGFINGPPDVEGVVAVDNIAAYVDMKLFIHNLGHAASAYLGYAYDSDLRYIHDVIAVPGIHAQVKACMEQAAIALNQEYPHDLMTDLLNASIDDLLQRFGNRALGDTLYRVGRDLYRKLDKTDRVTGALLLAAKHGVGCDAIADTFHAGCTFRATDEDGNLFRPDREFHENFADAGIIDILHEAGRLSEEVPLEGKVIRQLQKV